MVGDLRLVSKKSQEGASSGLYSLLAPKAGVVKQGGTLAPLIDFQVGGEWTMSMLQAKKCCTTLLGLNLLRLRTA